MGYKGRQAKKERQELRELREVVDALNSQKHTKTILIGIEGTENCYVDNLTDAEIIELIISLLKLIRRE